MSGASRVFMPLAWAPAQLVSTNAVNPDATWSAGTYASGVQVTHAVTYDGITVPHQWRSLDPSNTATPGADATKWQDLGPANTVAMFDPMIRRTAGRLWPLIARKTSRAGGLTVTLAPGDRFPGVALFGLEGDTLTLELLEGASVVHTETIDLATRRGVVGMLTYLETRWVQRDRAVFIDLPAYADMTLRLTIAAAGTAAIGGMVYGDVVELGLPPHYGATWTLETFVRPERDDFGNFIGLIKDAPFSPKAGVTIDFDNAMGDLVRSTLEALIYVPTVWVLNNKSTNLEPFLLIFGVFETPGVTFSYLTHNTMVLEVLGTT